MIAIQYEQAGGLSEYKKGFWSRIAFGARYGNQSLDLLLKYHASDLDNFNNALNTLIKAENSTT